MFVQCRWSCDISEVLGRGWCAAIHTDFETKRLRGRQPDRYNKKIVDEINRMTEKLKY